MSMLSTAEMALIAERHPGLLQRSFWDRYKIAIVATVTIAYFIFCMWFFAVVQVFGKANWDLAGTYLADWVSYEVRPQIRVAPDKTMQIIYPNYDPIGPNPNPDWLNADKTTVTRTIEIPGTGSVAAKKATGFMVQQDAPAQDAVEARTETKTEEVVSKAVVTFYSGGTVDVEPEKVIATRGNETLVININGSDLAFTEGTLPAWAKQSRAGGKVILSFGFSGWAEVEGNRVKVHKRFLGWAGFFYDTNSAYFNMPFSTYFATVFSDQRLDPAKSNFALAVDDFLYNPSWQHLDVWTKLLQTIVMAFVGTVLAVVVAFPLSFMAARNLSSNYVVTQGLKRTFDFLRSVDTLIWALFFTRAFGPGPLAGIAAIFITDAGTLGKLYAEALENIDNKQTEGIKSVGASPIVVRRFGVLPQVLPVFASQALYFWESNTRSATIIGAVGAGGIGLKLWEAMRTNSDWENVAYMVILILLVVYIFDGISNRIRSRLIGGK